MKRRVRGRFTLFGVVLLSVGAFLFATADPDAGNVIHSVLLPTALCAVTGLLLFGLGARTP